MGPRSVERGSLDRVIDRDRQRLLQWGRAQLSAEVPPKNGACGAHSTLQWGRAQLSAEVSITTSTPPPPTGLQWGRAQLSAEVTRTIRWCSPANPLQWGRAQLSAEVHVLASYHGERPSFNGAALS